MISRTDKKIKDLWDKRSEKYKDDISGVLPKSFPLAANKYIDDWQFDLVKGIVKNKRGYRILDIGCAYGRLSKKVLNKYSNVQTLGVDIAKSYVDLYNKDLKPRGKACVGDMRKLPFKTESVDLVLVATSLMYLIKESDQKKALREIFRVLKRGGKVLIIERDISGYNLITLWGLIALIRGKKNKEINAVGFDPKYMLNLIKNAGGSVQSKSGILFFTLSLPLLFIFNKFGNRKIISTYLKFVKKLDKVLGSILYPSIYISYVASKK